MNLNNRLRRRFVLAATASLTAWAAPAAAQRWDWPAQAASFVTSETGGKLKLGFESRARYESRTGQAFGRSPDLETGLVRHRLSLTYKPTKWLKVSGMVQDGRAPWYGRGAPNSVRDQADLQEGYFELFPDRKKGFGMTAGRMMLNYGETRLIGSPQWSNLSRTYDHARIYYRLPQMQLEMLYVSPVKVVLGGFNRPVLGDHVWGMYNSFPNLFKKSLLEVYVLRRDRNRPGGFTGGSRQAGTDRLGVNTYGGRVAGPLRRGVKYSLEGALQSGKVGPAIHRGAAWFTSLSRRWMVGGKPLDVLGEYKFASGTRNPQDSSRVATFDQLYPANHDKFGHQDLFGWRNIHNVRSVTTLGVTKVFALNFMYSNSWLAAKR
ncbi:MAG: hypothetical protein FJW34_11720, partial [Acidobacteria bacterium]|nr:hypothetical protein [Acidobacteriota bacterium]